jgi:uncharacterized membrane protein
MRNREHVRKDVKFTNKHRSRWGIHSLLLSFLSLGWLIYAVCCAYVLSDRSPNLLGGLGVLALLLSLRALVLAARALKEEDVFRGLPKVSLAAALLILLLWVLVYGLGFYVWF